jgi:uncharacterized protein (TIGR03085 family)
MKGVTAPVHTYPATATHTSVARIERAQLVDLLGEVGPGAPTLCAGWDAHHLAAHLVAREGSPLSIATALVRGRNGDEVVEKLVKERDLPALVEHLRGGPPLVSFFGLGPLDRLFNAVEFFVHHEDVRRAEPGYAVRELPGWALDQLWKGLGFTLGGLMRKAPVGAALRRSDTGQMRLGAKKPGTVIVEGLPTELALFANGRGAVADVTFDGVPDDVAALRAAHFGF